MMIIIAVVLLSAGFWLMRQEISAGCARRPVARAANMRLFLLLMACSIATACVIRHDEDAAAKKALEFVKVAFIGHDVKASYPLLHKELQKKLSAEKYEEFITKMHPGGYPTTITATHYEPVLGQKGITIGLVGENSVDKFYYRLIMHGTASKGYITGGIYRMSAPFSGYKVEGPKLIESLKPGYSVTEDKLPPPPPAAQTAPPTVDEVLEACGNEIGMFCEKFKDRPAAAILCLKKTPSGLMSNCAAKLKALP
jgi:hypothetical protein